MKPSHIILLLAVLSILSINCQKEVGYSGNEFENDYQNSAPLKATLQGNITDETGQPAIGVSVTVGSQSVVTDAHGYFRIREAGLDKNASLVKAEKSGYFKAYRSFRATSGVNQVSIQLIRKTLTGTINSSTGGSVTLANAAVVKLPSDAVVKSNGSAYSGAIQVYSAYIDPTRAEIARNIPGSFMADDKDGKRTTLASFGMMAVELESTSGERLQIASNHEAELTMPIPAASSATAPASISLWYLDEQRGIWKEEGSATRSGDKYIGNVKHFSYWNCDISLPTIGFMGTLKSSTGQALTYAYVRIRTTDNTPGLAYGYTDSLGQFSGLIPANVPLVLEILDECGNVGFAKQIGPFSSNTNLGVITLTPLASNSVVTIKGKVLDCAGQVVTKGYVIVYYDNMVRYVEIMNQGNFSIGFLHCSTRPSYCEIIGVNETTQQQGQKISMPFVNEEADAGDYRACGTSTEEFINYTLDGVNYSISDQTQDSIFSMYNYELSTNPVKFFTYMYGTHAQGSMISLAFINATEAPGSYPLDYLHLREFNRTALQRPFNIDMSSYPQSAGGFYEGSVSGQFKDTSNLAIVHTISCNFRLRRN